MKLLIIPTLFLLGGCNVTPLVFPSACNGDTFCEKNLNAQTLHYLGYKSAATDIMCSDRRVREVMEEECGNGLRP